MKAVPITLAILAATTAIAGTAALAQDRGEPRAPQTRAQAEERAAAMFARLDVNADGQLSPADHEAAERKRFDEADTDGNGQLSFAEVTAQREARGERRAERMAARGDEGRGMAQRAGLRMMRGGPGRSGPEMLERADSDGNGTVSRAEFTAGALARFDAADADKDGTLSAQERRAARPERPGRRDMAPPPPPADGIGGE